MKLKSFLKDDQIKPPAKIKLELDKLKITTLNGMIENLDVTYNGMSQSYKFM